LDRLQLQGLQSIPGRSAGSHGLRAAPAQAGDKHHDAKPLKGFGGAGVLEIVSDHVGDTYRAVYTLKFAAAIYVLHAFQKKSKTGSKTPATDMELIAHRLRAAEADYKARFAKGKKS
jgi:phage-related protein